MPQAIRCSRTGSSNLLGEISVRVGDAGHGQVLCPKRPSVGVRFGSDSAAMAAHLRKLGNCRPLFPSDQPMSLAYSISGIPKKSCILPERR